MAFGNQAIAPVHYVYSEFGVVEIKQLILQVRTRKARKAWQGAMKACNGVSVRTED